MFDIIPGLLEDFSMQTVCTLPAQQDGRNMPVRVTVSQKALRKERRAGDERVTPAIFNSAPHRTTLVQRQSPLLSPSGAESLTSGQQTPKQRSKEDL